MKNLRFKYLVKRFKIDEVIMSPAPFLVLGVIISYLKVLMILIFLLFPVVSNASFHFKNLGVSVFPAFSTDNMHSWFNTKFEVDWHINDWMELETSAVFLKVNTNYDKDLFFKELWLFTSFIANAKFKLPYNFQIGAGLGINYTNFCHYNLDETYIKWKPSYNLSLEWYLPEKTKWGFPFRKLELMYFFIPLNLKETSFKKYYYSHILALSVQFGFLWRKK